MIAPVPLGFAAGVGLIVISTVIDAIMAPRYAGGEKSEDGAVCQWLMISLMSNGLLAITLTVMGIGWISWHVETLSAAGAVLGATGIGVRYWAVWTLGRFFTWRVTIFDDHEIIQRGIFRYLRHPSYLGGMMAGWGISLALGNWIALLVFSTTHVPLMLYRIHLEEKVLLARFGDAYRDYMARTARLLPFVF
jgi:protein-S-isoprenylcysteine O-methyltransferase Ste14